MIEVRDFHKAYDETPAVAGLTFTVQPGEIMGLVGPNGAGKTTTLRALSGIIPPTQGNLSVDGHDLEKDGVAAKRALAYVPDDPNLFEPLTVWEHLQFIAKAYEVDGLEEKGMALLEQFELADRRDTLAQELSRGMRQKVAICCAYLHEPKALLLDEPLTGLDPRGIRTMKDSVTERAQNGTAVVVSSHMLELVEDLCSHLLIIHRGKQLYSGPIAGVRAAFADLSGDATLEEVFFHATEGPNGAPVKDAAGTDTSAPDASAPDA